MSINTELFQKIYDQISQHPETHDQSIFEYVSPTCGTQRCVAGWAVAFTHGSVYGLENGRKFPSSRGSLSSTAVEAADLLGLSDEQAAHLFYGTNNTQALELVHAYATKGDEA